MNAERGSLSLVAVACALVLCLAAAAAADFGAVLVARARAEAAADAAALAAVASQSPILDPGGDPHAAARAEAERNLTELVRCDCVVGTAAAEVEVELTPHLFFLRAWFGRPVRAVARAEMDPDVLTYRDSG